MSSGFYGIFIVSSNPLDITIYATWKFSGLPSNRVMGSGTTLDPIHFQFFLEVYFNIDPCNVQGWIIGEHGDSSLATWSSVTIGGNYTLDMISNKDYNLKNLDNIFIIVWNGAHDFDDIKIGVPPVINR